MLKGKPKQSLKISQTLEGCPLCPFMQLLTAADGIF